MKFYNACLVELFGRPALGLDRVHSLAGIAVSEHTDGMDVCLLWVLCAVR